MHCWPPSSGGEETRSGAAAASRQRPALTLGVTSPGQRLQLGLGLRKDARLANTKTLSESSSRSNSRHTEIIISFSIVGMGGGRMEEVFDKDNLNNNRPHADFISMSSPVQFG